MAQVFGAACLVAAVVVALGFGRFLSGRGDDVMFGPIPAGVPVNVIASMDPDAPVMKRWAAVRALRDFVLEYHRADEERRPGRKEFEERVAPALVEASKCPDFVMDRGHDYEFMRHLTDDEKRALEHLYVEHDHAIILIEVDLVITAVGKIGQESGCQRANFRTHGGVEVGA